MGVRSCALRWLFRVLGVLALSLASACATFARQPVDPDAPLVMLVLDRASVASFAREGRKRPGAPVQRFGARVLFEADADPAWCAFQAQWRAPIRRDWLGREIYDIKRIDAYSAARKAAGVSRPVKISFLVGVGEKALPFEDAAPNPWIFALMDKSAAGIAPGQSFSFSSAIFGGYARIALTSAEWRSVDFEPSAPLSFSVSQGQITLVGPFRLVVVGDVVQLQRALGDEPRIREAAARATGQRIDDVQFAPLAADAVDRCPRS